MNYKTHVMGGVLLGLLTVSSASNILNININEDISVSVIYMSGAVVGSIFPDIDHNGSYIGRRVKPLSKLINTAFGHRGATHSPFLIVLFTSILYLLNKLIWLDSSFSILIAGLFIGMISHVLLDLITKEGVPLFYPLNKEKISLIGITTGGFVESIIGTFLTVAALYLIVRGQLPLTL